MPEICSGACTGVNMKVSLMVRIGAKLHHRRRAGDGGAADLAAGRR